MKIKPKWLRFGNIICGWESYGIGTTTWFIGFRRWHRAANHKGPKS